MRFLDLTQDFSLHTPAFAGYAGPSIRWIKRLAFDKAGGQEITMTLHVSTHIDAPAHFLSGGKFVGDLPLDFLIGPSCVVDLERMVLGDYDLFGPQHVGRWEKDIRHRGPARALAEWVLERPVRWIAIDAGSADHPMNTVLRRLRADEPEEAEKKLGRNLDEIFPKADYQIMH